MAEDPRTQAPLITDEDARAAADAWYRHEVEELDGYKPKGGIYVPEAKIQHVLGQVAPRLRARWVAGERQQLADLLTEHADTLASFAADKTLLVGLIAYMLRLDGGTPVRLPDLVALVAEYRGGTR